MSLKIRAADDSGYPTYIIEWVEGYKRTEWRVEESDDLVLVLQDILATVEHNHTPLNPIFLTPAERHPVVPGSNPGAEAADRAAREQEMALRNGGAAISMGMGFENVPTFDDPATIPPVDWSH